METKVTDTHESLEKEFSEFIDPHRVTGISDGRVDSFIKRGCLSAIGYLYEITRFPKRGTSGHNELINSISKFEREGFIDQVYDKRCKKLRIDGDTVTALMYGSLLEKRVKALREEIESLKIELAYRPNGPGMLEAQVDFEARANFEAQADFKNLSEEQ